MKHMSVLTIGACAGLAYSGISSTPDGLGSISDESPAFFTITIDVSGVQFWDPQGSAFNELLSINIGAGIFVTGIGWDATLTTIGSSWASEATVGFQDEIFLAPGSGDDFPVSFMNYNSGGIIDLRDAGFDWIRPDSGGLVHLEFFDTFDDNPEAADAYFEAGSELFLHIGYPTPGSAVALSLGLLCCGRGRR